MTKWSISGLLLVVIGAVMLVFQKIGGLMGDGHAQGPVCIVDLVDPASLNWIDKMTFLHINHLLNLIVMAPLYLLLVGLGIVLLIISGFKK